MRMAQVADKERQTGPTRGYSLDACGGWVPLWIGEGVGEGMGMGRGKAVSTGWCGRDEYLYIYIYIYVARDEVA